MALLNFATQYKNVSKYKDLTIDSSRLDGSTENDYVKLIFTKDGHIITHGVDYIPWGADGTIPINRLPITDENNPDNQHLWDSATINKKINDSYVLNSAMRFKGTIGINTEYNGTSDTKKYLINDTKSDIPLAQVGDTYRVTKSGNYEGFTCEAGDLLMCIVAGSETKVAEWTIAQTNINGTVDYIINNVVHKIYTNDTKGLTIYAPVKSGSAGQFLVSGGLDNIPTWASPNDLTVGIAKKVANALSNGSGIAQFSYDGSAVTKINLSPATTSTIGGVIIDNGGTDKKPTISVTNTGKIYLTATNVRNALGYDPVGVNNWRPVYVDGKELQGNATDSGNLSIKHGLGIILTTPQGTKDIVFSANTTYTTEGKNYKVEADETTGGLYVNVPWSNTTYGVVTNTQDGLAPKVVNTNTSTIGQTFYLLASSDGKAKPSWYKLPTNAFTNTWRTIKLGDTSIGDKTLNIEASGDIYVSKAETDDTVSINFGISWYNLDTNKYETV